MLMHHPDVVFTGLNRTGLAMPETGIIGTKSQSNSEKGENW
jgi:hypothetical protein